MSNPKTGPRQLKPGPYQAKAVAWQYDGSHAILWCDKSKGGEHWRRLDEQCNGRFPEPDAKLMAAAPELLAACIAMFSERTGAAQLSDACQLAREAITKAAA